MSTTPLGRDVAVANQLAVALHEGGQNSILAVFLAMYYRHKRGEAPVNLPSAFMVGKFMHGRIFSSAIKGAEELGFIAKDKPESEKYALLHPTEKLIEFVQTVVEAEGSSYEVAQEHKRHAEMISAGIKRFNTLRPDLERDHPNETVAVSSKSGRYVVLTDEHDSKMAEFASSLDPDDFVYFGKLTPTQAAQ